MGLEEYRAKRDFNATPEPSGQPKPVQTPSHLQDKPDQYFLRFVIQKHAASRLHYDFRLELNGLLKSWAVPKGPSLNPKDRRLAVQVEDHPFEYRTFEGVIPEGQYGAGEVIVWDDGFYYVEQNEDKETNQELVAAGLRRGRLTITLVGTKLKGEFTLVRMPARQIEATDHADQVKLAKSRKKQEQWLLTKKTDQYATDEDILRLDRSVLSNRRVEALGHEPAEEERALTPISPSRPKRPTKRMKGVTKTSSKEPVIIKRSHDQQTKAQAEGKKRRTSRRTREQTVENGIAPMMATLVQEPFSREGWLFEIKWDGYRAIAEIGENDVRLYSRNSALFNDKYPEVTDSLWQIHRPMILDGEIVARDEKGRSDFQVLQNYQRHRCEENCTLTYYVFDLLSLDGQDLTDMPLRDRKTVLRQVLPDLPNVKFCDHVEEEGEEFFRTVTHQGHEGMIAKDGASLYLPGQRTSAWLKVKSIHRQEAIIIGYTEPKGARKHLGALLLAVHDDQGDLISVGHTGTGMDVATLSMLKRKLKPLQIEKSPVQSPPGTHENIHWVQPKLVCEVAFREWTSDRQMRQAVFLGLREDKPPEAVILETEHPTGPAIRSAEAMFRPRKLSIDEEPPEPKPEPAKRKTGETEIRLGVTLTNLQKLFWPPSDDLPHGITKRDLVNYYEQVAPYLMPYLKDRPMTLHRFPNGIARPGFYQKDLPQSVPEWVWLEPVYNESEQRTIHSVVCQNLETLLYLANLGCIEMNPWGSRVQAPENPDYAVLDLDPENVGFDKVMETALALKSVLDELDIPGYCKTSGATGLHVYVPLAARYNEETVVGFTHLLAQLTHERTKSFTSLERSPNKRRKKVYIDFLQNRHSQTVVSAYSVRPCPGAPVSTPLHWDEVTPALDPNAFTIFTIFERLDQVDDLWSPVLSKRGVSIEGVLAKMS